MSSQRMWSRQPAAHSLLAPHSVEDGPPFIDSGHIWPLSSRVHITGVIRALDRMSGFYCGAIAVGLTYHTPLSGNVALITASATPPPWAGWPQGYVGRRYAVRCRCRLPEASRPTRRVCYWSSSLWQGGI